jgi:hypothetical protein
MQQSNAQNLLDSVFLEQCSECFVYLFVPSCFLVLLEGIGQERCSIEDVCGIGAETNSHDSWV